MLNGTEDTQVVQDIQGMPDLDSISDMQQMMTIDVLPDFSGLTYDIFDP